MKGRLHYLEWHRPWTLVEDDGQLVDLEPIFWDFAEANKGEMASLSFALDRIALSLDARSDLAIDFTTRGAGVVIAQAEGFCFTNIRLYLAMAMERFNGRQIEVATSASEFVIEADPAEPVPQVLYKREGTDYGRIPDREAISRCKIGQGGQCCIFVVGGGGGLECAKFSELSRSLLERHANGGMNAGRIGNCRLAGRERDDV